ncbi:hypothetical protein FNV43_RR03654 [Rhamnella rubrinervis]|uniref:Cupin type-1 domain-containing protein n=1 Tax=Rhamnella rubrinervis TaxID=2594499 RepID=A0A8K0MPU4_9ROSA|nr:hypothetical protein FNV43_RR03654 [Rhamnella rubrinervis]
MPMAVLKSFLLVIFSLAITRTATAGDPNILTDFIVATNDPNPDGSFFTYKGFRTLYRHKPPSTLKVLKAGLAEFPALNGQSVSYAVLDYPAGSMNPPHTHPRSAELLSLFVEPFKWVLWTPPTSSSPKPCKLYNADPHKLALAISAFGSANAGTVSLPNTLFASGIDDNVLAISFKTDVTTIQALKAGLAPKP